MSRLESPSHYDDERRQIWADTVTRLTSSGRVFRADPEILNTYVEAVRSHRQASRLLSQTNVLLTRDGRAVENPALGVQRRSAEAMTRASKALGLDRIPAGDPTPPPPAPVTPPAPAAPTGGTPMTGGTRGRNGRFRRTPQSAARDMRAAELHGQGWTHERIAAELGFASRGKVSEAIDRAYALIVTPGAAAAKRLDFERLDRLVEKNWEALERPHIAVSNGRVVRRFIGIERDADGIERLDMDGKPIPVFEDVLDDGPIAVHTTAILRLLERRARMHGYDAPVQSRIEVITADMIESHIADLESQLARNDAADTSPT